ncbi:MAG: hypothetical protein J6D34_07900 [Atopobiaceae bacterium]|nr:hypothetical protein [Atopobiaceae bacterium]
MNFYRRLILVLVLTMVALSTFTNSAFAKSDNDSEVESYQIYVDERVSTEETSVGGIIKPKTKGNCTDLYPREWCNAHGYGNNRPVGARVNLNSKEKSCLIKWYGGIAKAISLGIVQNYGGAVVGAASTCVKLWYCLS